MRTMAASWSEPSSWTGGRWHSRHNWRAEGVEEGWAGSCKRSCALCIRSCAFGSAEGLGTRSCAFDSVESAGSQWGRRAASEAEVAASMVADPKK